MAYLENLIIIIKFPDLDSRKVPQTLKCFFIQRLSLADGKVNWLLFVRFMLRRCECKGQTHVGIT